MSACMRCGEEGPHYVPPSFGDTGFFSCDPTDGPKPSRTPERYTTFCVGCHLMIWPGETWERVSIYGYAHTACLTIPALADSPSSG